MSVCTFLASGHFMPPVSLETVPGKAAPCGSGFFLLPFEEVGRYTGKKYGVFLEWNGTDAQAERLLQYITEMLRDADSIELWYVWLMAEGEEYEDSPVIHMRTISIGKLGIEELKRMDCAEIWNHPDKRYPERPSFYCLTITR